MVGVAGGPHFDRADCHAADSQLHAGPDAAGNGAARTHRQARPAGGQEAFGRRFGAHVDRRRGRSGSAVFGRCHQHRIVASWGFGRRATTVRSAASGDRRHRRDGERRAQDPSVHLPLGVRLILPRDHLAQRVREA